MTTITHTRSKAVEQARGCVATKIGLFDMLIDLEFGSVHATRGIKAKWNKLVEIRAMEEMM